MSMDEVSLRLLFSFWFLVIYPDHERAFHLQEAMAAQFYSASALPSLAFCMFVSTIAISPATLLPPVPQLYLANSFKSHRHLPLVFSFNLPPNPFPTPDPLLTISTLTSKDTQTMHSSQVFGVLGSNPSL